MSDIGDAPVPGDAGAPAAEGGGDGEGLVSYETALAEAAKEWSPEGDEAGEGEAAPKETEATADDAEKKEPEAKEPEKKDEEKPKEEQQPSKLFAAIARERNKVKEREAKVAAREKELEGVTVKAKAFDDVRRRLHEDPYGLLVEAGGEELVNKLLDAAAGTVQSPAEQRVAKLEREMKERDERAKADADRQMVERHQRLVAEEVTKAGEKFDLVNSLGEHDAVYQLIVRYHAKHGHVLPTIDAAEIVEKALTERLSKSKKFGAREAEKPPQARNGNPPPKRSNTTLSSVAVGQVPAADDDGPQDPQERVAWALRLATG